jgi:molybdate transport system ATP-binding protein
LLEARIRLALGRFQLDVDVAFPPEGTSVVFGPSGSGKTTILRCLAGLEGGSQGRVRMGDQVWQDSEMGIRVPAHRRRIGYVFQEANLFAHQGVRQNLEYGLKRSSSRQIEMADVVRWLGLTHLMDRRTVDLSGGERQRVAIGRSLLASPRLLLMDEPLSSLDEVGRREILDFLPALPEQFGIPLVYVTHSLPEALRMADHMVWLVGGRVERSGPPEEVLGDAGFASWQGEEAAVVVRARVASHDDWYHLTRLAGPWGPLYIRRCSAEENETVRLQIRARDVSLSLDSETRSSILNEFEMRVVNLVDAGEGEVTVELGQDSADATLVARITALSCERLSLEPGSPVYARVKSVAIVE